MFWRILGLLLFLALVGLVVLNFTQIMDYTTAINTKHATQADVDGHYWSKAISKYETDLKGNPNNHNLALRLGWLYLSASQDTSSNPDLKDKTNDYAAKWRMEQAQKAEATYRDILKSDPTNIEAQIGLANAIQTNLSRTNEAVDVLREALRNHPGSAPLLNEIGNVYKRAADNPMETRPEAKLFLYDHARYYYGLSTELDPNYFQSQFNLGVAFQNLSNAEAAAYAYCKAIVLMPDSYEARYNLGLALIDKNYLDEGYRQLDKSIDILKNRGTEADMRNAQRLAGQIQHVKSKVYNSDSNPGLDASRHPDFLKSECLLKPMGDKK